MIQVVLDHGDRTAAAMSSPLSQNVNNIKLTQSRDELR
jgi:hypothetical protein